MVLLNTVVEYVGMGNTEVSQTATNGNDHIVKDDSMDNRVFKIVSTFMYELLQRIRGVKIRHETSESSAKFSIHLLLFMSLSAKWGHALEMVCEAFKVAEICHYDDMLFQIMMEKLRDVNTPGFAERG